MKKEHSENLKMHLIEMIHGLPAPQNGKLFLSRLLAHDGIDALLDFVKRASECSANGESMETKKLNRREKFELLSLPINKKTRRWVLGEIALNAAVVAYSTASLPHLFDSQSPITSRAHSVVGYSIAVAHAWTTLDALTERQLLIAAQAASDLSVKIEIERHNESIKR